MKKIQYFIWFSILFTSVHCVNAQDIHINNTVTYNSDQNISGDIYIHNSGTLTIKANIYMAADKAIFIENGGKLKCFASRQN